MRVVDLGVSFLKLFKVPAPPLLDRSKPLQLLFARHDLTPGMRRHSWFGCLQFCLFAHRPSSSLSAHWQFECTDTLRFGQEVWQLHILVLPRILRPRPKKRSPFPDLG